MTAPLEGVRVVELAEVIQGPLTGRILADLGADVIKVEPPAGDSIRFWEIQFDLKTILGDGSSMAFNLANRNKRDIALDLHRQSGVEILHQLVASSQVFITNLRTSALKKL